MVLITLSAKHQTSVSAEVIRSLNLKPGTKFRQWHEGNRIFMEPVQDMESAYGVFFTGKPAVSREEERSAMERAVADDVMGIARDE